MAKNLLYLDLETSGLYPDQGHCILGIGAIHEKIDKGEISEFSLLITPTDLQWQLAVPQALQVNGLTLARLQAEGMPFAQARSQFLAWLLEHRIKEGETAYVGQNPLFDLTFLGSFMGNELNFIDFPVKDVIDIRDLYSILVNRRKVPFLRYRSGENISKGLGVEPEPWPHDALEGARAVFRNYKKLVELGART